LESRISDDCKFRGKILLFPAAALITAANFFPPLVTLTSPLGGVSSYTYNGLGDRLGQTVNSVTTNYTLDLNAGLTQVLADGESTYLYGLGRIAQLSAEETAYFLGDALGSVRQLTDESGGGVPAVVQLRQYVQPVLTHPFQKFRW
jgi:YD repeat-containing protein